MTNVPEEWLDYDEFAAGIDTNRLPQSDALMGQSFEITLDNGRVLALKFNAINSADVTLDGVTTTEWYEAVLSAENTYFLDLTFTAAPAIAETLIVNTSTRRVLSIRCTIREEGEVPGEPRVAQDWVAGVLAGGEVSNIAPHETRDLIGLRAFYHYSPNHTYEHIYVSSKRYAWQNLVGVQRGHGDTDLATTFKFADDQYVFGFREFIIPVASVFFYNWDDMRSTGKFLGETGDGEAQNSAAGAFIEKASMTFYPQDKKPV